MATDTRPALPPIRRISEMTEEECDALLLDAEGRLRLSLVQKHILVGHALAVAYGYGKVCVTVTQGRSRISTEFSDLLREES